MRLAVLEELRVPVGVRVGLPLLEAVMEAVGEAEGVPEPVPRLLGEPEGVPEPVPRLLRDSEPDSEIVGVTELLWVGEREDERVRVLLLDVVREGDEVLVVHTRVRRHSSR